MASEYQPCGQPDLLTSTIKGVGERIFNRIFPDTPIDRDVDLGTDLGEQIIDKSIVVSKGAANLLMNGGLRLTGGFIYMIDAVRRSDSDLLNNSGHHEWSNIEHQIIRGAEHTQALHHAAQNIKPRVLEMRNSVRTFWQEYIASDQQTW